jgi:NAD-dependent dihydropyrimidine dehydrogenase PreA subunit
MIKKIPEQQLNEWVDGLIRQTTVIGVKAERERFVFGPLTDAADLRLDYDVTALPPRQFLQPPCETLLSFTAQGYQSVGDDHPFVLFGVHPYDVVAICQMDAVFSQDNADTHYLHRRENATIVAVDVQKASPTVFAGAMGNSHVESGWDILLTKIGDEYLVQVATEKGKALAAGIASARDASPADLKAREGVWKENLKSLRKSTLNAAPATWPKLLDSGYDHPVWKEKSELCFSCGSCITTCPTCYCFDVREETDWSLKAGTRVRVWDGCMLTGFATVAGNHNFRKDKAARFRHRYYRKGKFVPSKIGGQIACVGCGRCVSACVSKIANPVEVFNRLMEAQ